MYGIIRLGAPDSLVTVSGQITRCNTGNVSFTMRAPQSRVLNTIAELNRQPLYLEVTDKPLVKTDNPHVNIDWQEDNLFAPVPNIAGGYDMVHSVARPKKLYHVQILNQEFCNVGKHNIRLRLKCIRQVIW